MNIEYLLRLEGVTKMNNPVDTADSVSVSYFEDEDEDAFDRAVDRLVELINTHNNGEYYKLSTYKEDGTCVIMSSRGSLVGKLTYYQVQRISDDKWIDEDWPIGVFNGAEFIRTIIILPNERIKRVKGPFKQYRLCHNGNFYPRSRA